MPDKTILGIHTYLSGRGSTASTDLDDGHAWISVTKNGKTEYYGLWPDAHDNVVDNGKGSDIRVGIENGFPTTASRYVELTPEQAKKLEAALTENVEWGYTNTCASWASKTYSNVTGQKIDASEYLNYRYPKRAY